MKPVSFEEACKAKAKFRASIGRPKWLRGCGVSLSASGGYCVCVNVASVTPEVESSVPHQIGGVPVVVRAVGDIELLGDR